MFESYRGMNVVIILSILGVIVFGQSPLDAPVDISFDAIYDTFSRPADPTIAVGETRVLFAVNGLLSMHEGPPYYAFMDSTTPIALFDRIGERLFDPRVIWNHYSKRFVALYQVGVALDTSYTVVAVSRFSEPSSLQRDDEEWVFTTFDVATEVPPNPGGKKLFGDYPMLGYDQYNAYIGYNMFATDAEATDSPTYSKLYAAPWETLLEGGDDTKKEWLSLQAGNVTVSDDLIYSPQPAVRYADEGSSGDHFSVSHDDSVFVFYRTLNPDDWDNIEITGSTNNPAPTQEPDVCATGPMGDQPACPLEWKPVNELVGIQQDSETTIDLGDNRILNTVYRENLGRLWAAVSHDDGGFASVLIYEFDVTGSDITCESQQLIAIDDWHVFYPAVTVTEAGNVAVFMNGMKNDAVFISVLTAFSLNGTWEEPQLVYGGAAPYDTEEGSARWGDYNGAVVDPVDPDRVWGTAKYPNSDGRWVSRAFSYRLCEGCRSFVCPRCANDSPCFDGECVCDTGKQFEGYTCPNICENGCSNHGTCDYFNRTCLCDDGYGGSTCSFTTVALISWVAFGFVATGLFIGIYIYSKQSAANPKLATSHTTRSKLVDSA